MRLSYELVACRWHRYSPSHRSGHSFRSAGGFACCSVKNLSDPCWKCLTLSLKNLKNLLVDFYLCFRLPYSQGFCFQGVFGIGVSTSWEDVFGIGVSTSWEFNTENQACKKTSLRLSPKKVGKKVKTKSSPVVLSFLSHSIVVTFPDKKTDRTHICPPEMCLLCVCTHIHTAGFTTYFSKPIRIHLYDLILNHSQFA